MNNFSDKMKKRFKSFTTENYIIFAIELILAVTFIYFTINLWIRIKLGITFFGEKFKAYEIVVSVLVTLLSIMMVAILIYEICFKDFEKEKNIDKKIIKNGHVITVEKVDEDKEENKNKETDD